MHYDYVSSPTSPPKAFPSQVHVLLYCLNISLCLIGLPTCACGCGPSIGPWATDHNYK